MCSEALSHPSQPNRMFQEPNAAPPSSCPPDDNDLSLSIPAAGQANAGYCC
jgi:hypothetical protein